MADVPRPGSHVSPRWAGWRRSIPIPEYEERFARLAASGLAAHGEADLVESYRPQSVLDAGCGTGRVAIELARRGIDVVGVDLDDEMLDAARTKAPGIAWICADLATLDLGRSFDVVAVPGNVLLFCRPADRSAVAHRCAAHVGPAGRLIVGFSLERDPGAANLAEVDAAASAEGLVLDERLATWDRDEYAGGDYAVSVYRRPGEAAG
jgi:SAM-dependent methyltransferase